MARVLELDASSLGTARWLGYTLAAIALMLGMIVGGRAFGMLLAMTDCVVRRYGAAGESRLTSLLLRPRPSRRRRKRSLRLPRAPQPRLHRPPGARAGRQSAHPGARPERACRSHGQYHLSGNADNYAGGVTAANGTSPTAGARLDESDGRGRWNGPPEAGSAPAGARSIAPGLAEEPRMGLPVSARGRHGADRRCVRDAADRRGADGSASNVRIVQDPGNGFGRQARSWALKKRDYTTALDRDGTPIAQSITARVHFTR